MQSQESTHSSLTQQQQVQPTPSQTQSTTSTPTISFSNPLHDNNFPALPDHTATSWTKVEYKKRPRDTPDTHKQSTKLPTLTDYWLNRPSTSTSNKFDALMEPETDQTQTRTQPTPPKPPPIFVAGVHNIQPLHDLLIKIAVDAFELKVLQENQVKIQPKSPDAYRTIIKALAEKNTEFHTYQPKVDRSYRTVLRGLHYSTDTQDIRAAIESHGHIVVNVFNIRQARSNTPLPLFFVDLKPNENNKEIYLLRTLLYTKITFEPPRPKRTIPQCTKCQRYGHTQAYCFHTPRCVKCAGSHHTSQCTRKDKSGAVICVLCSGNHPANYKGCTIYKELQKRTFPQSHRRQDAKRPQDNQPLRTTPPSSYAATLGSSLNPPLITASHSPQTTTPLQPLQPQTDQQDLKEAMKGLMDQMGTILNLLTTLLTKLA
jgi:hypothetical protein